MIGCIIDFVLLFVACFVSSVLTSKWIELENKGTKDEIINNAEHRGRNQGAAWAIAYLVRDGEHKTAETMARLWRFSSMDDLAGIDEYDAKEIRSLIEKIMKDR